MQRNGNYERNISQLKTNPGVLNRARMGILMSKEEELIEEE